MTLLEKVRESPPHWANDTIRPFDEDLFREALPFATRRYWCDSASVNVFRIVGTDHESYKNKTWLWMLENGQRIFSNLREYEKNPEYYLKTGKKNDLSYVTMDGMDFYIRQGTHRSTIARFDFHYRGLTTLHGVTVEDIRIDRQMYRMYRELKKMQEERFLPWVFSHESETLSREDTAGWMLETYRIRIRLKTPGKEWIFEEADAVRNFLASGSDYVRTGRKKWLPFLS
ncbi:hypothetical protein ACSYAY_01245 [Leptospirillum ferriphilum]|uniref:Uncharacterized protein n=1 Tax=Leptospirillum ferriphilum TaxID=178606 RepID=A0A1V3SV78_9BACT|nr:hypothetical protein [Leptospirillum ferriphilum]OOH72771.1 hypothetical protein BOX24_05125 [Leptospirillum ferriphilum]